jgi:prepilin signal peptidase PulO-like enzyme (type II secretory pathway)
MSKMESLIFPNSRCPKCGKRLKKRSLIPIASFLIQRGRCLECGEKIDRKYFFIELTNTIIYAMLFCTFGASFKTLYLGILSSVIFLISYVDFECMIVDIRAILFLFFLGVIHVLFNPISPLFSIVSMVFYYAFIVFSEKILKVIKKSNEEFIGDGDRKIIAVCGFFLTGKYIGHFFLLAGLFGVITALGWKILKKGKKFPFGPALLLSLFTLLLI